MKKQISAGIVLSFISQAVTIAVGLAYTPIAIRLLGQSEYGLYQLVSSVVNYLNLMNFGFSGAYIRYYVIARNKSEKDVSDINGMFMKVFLTISLLCLCAGTILYFNIGILGNRLSAEDYITARKLLIILVINLSISFPNSLYASFMSANERFVYQKIIGIAFNIAIPAMNIIMLYRGYGSVGVVATGLFFTILRLIFNIWYCRRCLKMRTNFRYFNASIFKDLLGYTFFIFLSDIVDQLNSNVDKLLLGRMLGTISVAVYSVAYNLKNYYTTLSWIIPEMFIPEANRLAIEKTDNRELTKLFTNVGKFNNYLMLLILSGFFLLGRQFIHLWVGYDYDTSYYATLILMSAGYIPAIQTLGVNIQNAKKMHQMRSIIYFFVACLNVVTSIILIKKYGVIGACIGTLIAAVFGQGIFMNFYYHKKIGLNVIFFWKEMLKWILPVAVLTSMGVIALHYLTVNSWVKLIAFACAYSCLYLIVLFFIGLDKNQRHIIGVKLQNLVKRGSKNEN